MEAVTSLVALTLFVVLLAYPVKRLVKWFGNREIVNKIPGPRSYYIIGNVFDYLGDTEQLFKNMRKMASDFNEIYKVWMGYIAAVNLLIPEDVEIVIGSTENMQKSKIYEPMLPWLKTGLLTSSGKKWHTRRKILTPAFHFNILQHFVKIFGRQTRQFLKQLDAQCDQAFVDVMPSVTDFALKSICETAMGVQLDEKNEMQIRYRKALNEINGMIVGRTIQPWLYERWIWILTPMHWREIKLIKYLHSFSRKVIEGRKQTFEGSIISKIEDVEFMSKKRLAMLDLMLSAKEDGDTINDEGIQEEVDTFIMEGHDTTASAIGFTILCLANHPEIQNRVYEELVDTFGNDDTDPTLFDLQNLKYTEMCIKESLRMYPSVPFISRLASKDIDTFSGYRIPKGTHIHIHIYDMHHNPKIYPDPEKFDPERFLPENSLNRHPFAFLPFSGGSRNCIGQRFAMLEIKSIICGLLRKFKLEAVDMLAFKPILQEIVLRPKDGVRVKLIRRK